MGLKCTATMSLQRHVLRAEFHKKCTNVVQKLLVINFPVSPKGQETSPAIIFENE
jgi:hypothetical protein